MTLEEGILVLGPLVEGLAVLTSCKIVVSTMMVIVSMMGLPFSSPFYELLS